MSEQRRRGPMGGRGRMMSGEKAKDFKGSMAENPSEPFLPLRNCTK